MTPNLGKTTFTDQELAALRADATAYIERHAMTKVAFAEECDVPEGTFGPWLKGSYGGDNQKPAAKVYRFLNARREQASLAASVPVAPEWQETKSARKVMAALEHGQVFGDLVVIGVGPGVGKTATITQYQAIRPRVWVRWRALWVPTASSFRWGRCRRSSAASRRCGRCALRANPTAMWPRFWAFTAAPSNCATRLTAASEWRSKTRTRSIFSRIEPPPPKFFGV